MTGTEQRGPLISAREVSVVGHWDHHAVELFAQESPDAVLQTLPPGHGFHANGIITLSDASWLHLGWDDANARAYRALVTFCLQTGRRWITSYANDPRAALDARFFGWAYPGRDEKLREIFGPPAGAIPSHEETP